MGDFRQGQAVSLPGAIVNLRDDERAEYATATVQLGDGQSVVTNQGNLRALPDAEPVSQMQSGVLAIHPDLADMIFDAQDAPDENKAFSGPEQTKTRKKGKG